MKRFWTRSTMLALCILLAGLFFTACAKEEQPTRWQKAQQDSAANQPATSEQSLPGSSFNPFFPTAQDTYDIVYTQEKTGFAEARLRKDGKGVALLSIFDTVNNPDAAAKYQQSTETLAGYPVVDIGSKGTGILVANRFQVQVRSTDDSFSRFDREDWLQNFDLNGLAGLQ